MENFERFVRERQLNEKFSDIEYVIDQLINSMEHYDEKSWIEHMSSETDLPPDVLREIWKEWIELSGQVKGQNAYGWEKWLEKFEMWSLIYRTELVLFSLGFISGLIIGIILV